MYRFSHRYYSDHPFSIYGFIKYFLKLWQILKINFNNLIEIN